MTIRHWFMGLMAVLACCVGCSSAVRSREIIGKDSVPGWQIRNAPADSWAAKDGVLSCTSTGGLWGGWIGSTTEYTDLMLELEFKVSPGANSGVYLRTPKTGHPSAVALEIQILDDYAEKNKTLKPAQFCGSIYKVVAPSKRVSRPAGEWNRMRITAIRDRIVVELNGEKIVDADAKSCPELAKRSPRGFVGFQDHHSLVWFRNVRLTDLSESSAGAAR
jgi:hypothetical protein